MSGRGLRLGLLAALVFGPAARAETGWLTSRGRVQPDLRLEVFGGFTSAGAGLVAPLNGEASRALGIEVAFDLMNRFAEARLTGAWQLAAARFASLTATAAVNGFAVPAAPLALGGGAHSGLSLALGGRALTFDVALDVGAEGFSAGPSRLPLRLALGLSARLGRLMLSALTRAGADVVPGRFLVVRGEAVLAIGWCWPQR